MWQILNEDLNFELENSFKLVNNVNKNGFEYHMCYCLWWLCDVYQRCWLTLIAEWGVTMSPDTTPAHNTTPSLVGHTSSYRTFYHCHLVPDSVWVTRYVYSSANCPLDLRLSSGQCLLCLLKWRWTIKHCDIGYSEEDSGLKRCESTNTLKAGCLREDAGRKVGAGGVVKSYHVSS